MHIKELSTIKEMELQFEMITHLYPNLPLHKYAAYLQEMIPHNYKQLAIFENDVCVAMTGFWFGTKLWTGKYIEIDNFIVHPNHRMKGLGKIMTDYLQQKAKDLSCTCIALDAFTGNFNAHRFYYNQGYEPRGFHFIKTIDVKGFS
ncbi:MAG: GNAT family N-acetyltransferase [Flavobacterium sp.]|nr:GNAT family N-acetyltransferase [Flavobacterium sp.]